MDFVAVDLHYSADVRYDGLPRNWQFLPALFRSSPPHVGNLRSSKLGQICVLIVLRFNVCDGAIDFPVDSLGSSQLLQLADRWLLLSFDELGEDLDGKFSVCGTTEQLWLRCRNRQIVAPFFWNIKSPKLRHDVFPFFDSPFLGPVIVGDVSVVDIAYTQTKKVYGHWKLEIMSIPRN